MREIGFRRFDVAVCALALVALLVGGAGSGLVLAQEATPVAGEQPAPVSTEPATLVSTSTPSASPTTTATSLATPAQRVRALGVQTSIVPNISATDFSPGNSTFSFPQGYSTATMTAKVTLSATGDVADIAPWQITLQGDPNRELISITPTGFDQMDFTQLSYQGLAAPVAGVTVDNTGVPVSTANLLIVHGDQTGFTSGAPNTLSFDITLLTSPTWADLPGTYSGGLILTISAATPSAP